MVKWQGRRGSRNVRVRSGGGGARSAAVGGLLQLLLSRFGVGGLVVVGLAYLGLRAAGVDILPATSQGGAETSKPPSTEDQKFVSVILRETEVVWEELFRARGETYPQPTLNIFRGQVTSACGRASAAVGPFYCPGDREIYLDTQFFDELSSRFGAPGDFAAAYVIAHEVGHHVQTVTGIGDKVRALKKGRSEAEANAVQVLMELQADCYAGVWAHHAERTAGILEAGDIEEGLRAAAAIGDDTLQRNAGRRVTPESFTHGSSEQRVRWFRRGYQHGKARACDTFRAEH